MPEEHVSCKPVSSLSSRDTRQRQLLSTRHRGPEHPVDQDLLCFVPLPHPPPPPTHPPTHPSPPTHPHTLMPPLSCVQVGLHEQYGGVKPDVAQAAHAAAIQATVDGAIAAAGISPDQLSAVAVTIGPGLSLCLQVRLTHRGGGERAVRGGGIGGGGFLFAGDGGQCLKGEDVAQVSSSSAHPTPQSKVLLVERRPRDCVPS